MIDQIKREWRISQLGPGELGIVCFVASCAMWVVVEWLMK